MRCSSGVLDMFIQYTSDSKRCVSILSENCAAKRQQIRRFRVRFSILVVFFGNVVCDLWTEEHGERRRVLRVCKNINNF